MLASLTMLADPAGATLDPEPLTTWGSGGTGPGQFQGATGVGVDAKNRVYAGDDLGGRVERFRADTSFLDDFGTSSPGKLDRPYGLEVDIARNRVWVASSEGSKIIEFKLNGDFVRRIGPNSVTPSLAIPYDVAVDPKNGNVFVVEIFEARVLRFSRTGAFIDQWPATGTNPPYLRGVVVDPHNRNIYVTDDNNSRVVVYTRQGVLVDDWDSWTGGTEMSFSHPFGITATDEHIHVADEGSANVFEFTNSGSYVGETDGGSEPFSQPRFMAVNKNQSRLFVTDVTDNLIYKFRV